MTLFENAAIAIGLLAFVGWAIAQYRTDWNRALLTARIAAAVSVAMILRAILGFPLPAGQSSMAGRGTETPHHTGILAALYFSMAMGMAAHFLHRYFEVPKQERPSFDLGQFVAPLLVSPIVFIPLYAAIEQAKVDLAGEGSARIMFLLVAFENGFFWKEYFENRRRRAVPTAPEGRNV